MVDKILADPIPYAVAFFIALMAVGIFLKIVGNPLTYLIDKLCNLLPLIMKELKGEGGKAGIVNIIIVFAILILALSVLLKPSILAFFSSNSDVKLSSLFIVVVAAVTFLISLKLVANAEKSFRLLKKD